ncbi:hypothetical protein DUNSADRAFT_9338 [Dunaliella salina]|uniref:Peptidylprolyl isomerase n=1 Tax=Dunaliella salina TaxID=3046 RepID=A0ABQ7H5E7_DUNSA|nr:hypothetical protein DUNSADRAFT_9338 [Dunaliella salina]|eukprot:KAF5842079.1 hypothetical protein DUNSADRAFT_9338 [Dunaliella salina]
MQEDLGEDRGPQGQREEPQKGSQGSIPQQGPQEQQQHQQPDLEQRDGRSKNGQQQQQQQRLSEHKNGSARKEQQQEQQQQPACDEHQQCDKLQAGQQQQQWQEQQQEPQVIEEQELQPQSHQHPQHQQQQQQQCEGQECEGQHQWEHHQQQQHHHHQHQQQRQQDLRSCIDDGEAADESMLLRHDKPFRVSLLRDANTLAESAALNIIIPSLPAYNDSHFIVGQVVRGFGMARFMESCASNEDVVYGIYSKAPSQKGPRTGPYRISGCRLLPPTASLEDVPVVMDGTHTHTHTHTHTLPPGTHTHTHRLCGAEAMRAAANAAFKAGAWEAAACKYTHALRYLSLRSLQSSALKYSEKQQILDLQCRTLLNRSATAVHLGQGMAAMTDAKNVLDQCPEGHPLMPKALYRLGQGLMGVGRHEEAVERLQQALQLTGPNAPDIRAAITHAKQLLKQQRARQGEAYARALQGWGSRRAPGTSRRRGADFDGGEFEEGKAWLLNPKAEAVLERLGGDAPFRGMISMQGCDEREGRT